MIFFNYSSCMDEDLKRLEQKLSNLIDLYHALSDENFRLRQDLTKMQSDNTLLKIKMTQASERVEALIESLP